MIIIQTNQILPSYSLSPFSLPAKKPTRQSFLRLFSPAARHKICDQFLDCPGDLQINQMSDPATKWCEQTDELLKYLYHDMKIFDWNAIAKELAQRLSLQADAAECRSRFLQKYGPVQRGEWTPEEERELYRLHNQNGNRWAIISQNLLGRDDNSVKNHFYSKLRKSLRTLNKIAKLHLKKSAKEISDVVIYKLTEATDESLKPNCQIPEQIIAMCYDLKNRLLEYEMDQKDIKHNLDYANEKQILIGLSQFNHSYKKKSKKQKTCVLGSENLKRKKTNTKQIQYQQSSDAIKIQQPEINFKPSQHSIQTRLRSNQQPKQAIAKEKTTRNTILVAPIAPAVDQSYYSAKSESDYSQGQKRTVNYLIKPPPKQPNIQAEAATSFLAVPPNEYGAISELHSVAESKTQNRIEDILKAEGILQNSGERQYDFFRRSSSIRSFSMCSQSSNPDMFNEDVKDNNFRQYSEMENDSHFFKSQNE